MRAATRWTALAAAWLLAGCFALDPEGVRELDDPVAARRQAAAAKLGESGDPGALGPLLAHLAGETEPGVRASLAIAIGKLYLEREEVRALGTAEGVAAIAPLAQDVDAAPRKACAMALGWLGDPDGRPAILPLTRDGHKGVRAAALIALGELSDDLVPPELAEAAYDADPWIRVAAVTALGKLPGDAALPRLLAATHDPIPGVRQTAVKVLQASGDARAVAAVKAAAQDPAPEVRAVASAAPR